MACMFRAYSELILKELHSSIENIQEKEIHQVVQSVLNRNRVFVSGAGRSRLVMKSFAMRLMQMGMEVYVVGETVTPSITSEDLLIIGSGSGETSGLLEQAKKCSQIGTSIVLISSKQDSSIGKLSNLLLNIESPTKLQESSSTSIQPMGTLFEQSMQLVLDSIVLIIMEETKLPLESMVLRHANLE